MKFKKGDLLTFTDEWKSWMLDIEKEKIEYEIIVQVVEIQGELVIIKVFSRKEFDTEVYSEKYLRFATEMEIKKYRIKEMF
jgi:hypothetical protein